MLMTQAIQVEEDRVVCIRFGHDHDSDCMAMDETMYSILEKVQNFAVFYLGKLVRLRVLEYSLFISGHFRGARF